MINLEAMADRIAAAKTRPARATVEDQVLREILADAEDTLGRALRANTPVSLAPIRDYADAMCRRLPNFYLTVPVPFAERVPILADWDARMDRNVAIYCVAERKAGERIEQLLAAMPQGTPTPTMRPGAGKGGDVKGKKDDRPEGWWAWVGGAVLALAGFLLGVPGWGFLLGLILVAYLHFSGRSKPVPGLPPPPSLAWLLLPAALVVLLFARVR